MTNKFRVNFADFQLIFAILLKILSITLAVSVICFYVSSHRYFFSQAIQISSVLMLVSLAISVMVGLVKVTRSKSYFLINKVAGDIVFLVFFTAFIFISVKGIVTTNHSPWILALIAFVTPFFLNTVIRRETIESNQFLLGAILAGGLTLGQIALVGYYDTWLFISIDFIPIPLLAITVAITGLASVFFILAIIYAIVLKLLVCLLPVSKPTY